MLRPFRCRPQIEPLMALVIVPNTPPTWRDKFTPEQLQRRRERAYNTRVIRNTAEHRAKDAARQREYERKQREQNPVEFRARKRMIALRFRERHSKEELLQRQRAVRLKCIFGLTMDQYRAMLAEQNAMCAICGHPHDEGLRKGLVVDHNHTTGKVRGLLCRHCNTAIGQLKEDPSLFQRAVSYLAQHLKEE